MFFDALGGGDTLEALINGLGPKSWVHVYGLLEGKPLKLEKAINLCRGVSIAGYLLFNWWGPLPEEEKNKIRSEYSKWLKGDLSTVCHKQLKYSEIEEGLELAVSKTI